MVRKLGRLPDFSLKDLNTRGLFFVSGITFVTNLVFAIVVLARFGDIRLGYLLGAHSILGLTTGLFVISQGLLSRWKILIADVILLTPSFITVWESHLLGSNSGVLFDQLFAPKILMLGWALFVPSSYLLHILYLTGLGVESVFIWNDMSVAAKAPFVPAEPAFTAMAFFIGLVFIVARWRKEKIERELIALRARTLVLTDVARLFLSIRDRANTPLQNLFLIMERLERGESPSPRMIAAMRRSLEKINSLHGEFSCYEDLVEWPAPSGEPEAQTTLDHSKNQQEEMRNTGP
jgi:hypothetical protein